MNIQEHQKRSLTVCAVSFERPELSVQSTPRKSFATLFTKTPKPSSHKQDHVLVLTCDRLVVLQGNDTETGLLPFGSRTQQDDSNPNSGCPEFSLPLSSIIDVYSKGSMLVLVHNLSLPTHRSPHTDTFGDDKKSSTIGLHTASAETASELAATIKRALERLLSALVWLDRGLPLKVASEALQVSTVSCTLSDDTPIEIVVSRSPQWGSTISILPAIFSFKKIDHITIDLSSPFGPCHALISPASLLKANQVTVDAMPNIGELNGCDDCCPTTMKQMSLRVTVARGAAALNPTREITDHAAAPNPTIPSAVHKHEPIHTENENNLKNTSSLSTKWVVTLLTHVSGVVAVVNHFYNLVPAIHVAVFLECISVFAVALLLVMWILGRMKNSRMMNREKHQQKRMPEQEQEEEGERHALISSSLTSIVLVQAEIIEGQEESVDDETTLATKIGRQLTRRLDESLRIRDQITMTKERSSTTQIIDVGAVSLRRVLTSTIHAQRSLSLAVSLSDEFSTLEDLKKVSPHVTTALYDRYITACAGDKKTALSRLRATAHWRASHSIDTVLQSPIPQFHAIKAAYLHSVIGWTTKITPRMPVIVEGMGGFKAALNHMRKNCITPAEMIQQFIFVIEWILSTVNSDQFVRVYDLKGISLLDIADKEAIHLGQSMMDILEKYYPERMARAYVVNTPSFFSTAWKMVRPMLDPRTAKKIHVVSSRKATLNALLEIMDIEDIPEVYGGKSRNGTRYGILEFGDCGWYNSKEEQQLRELASKLNNTKQQH